MYDNHLEDTCLNDKNTPIIPVIDSFGTLKGLEHSVNPQLMKYARETESLNAHARQESRRRLFAAYPFLHQVNDVFCLLLCFSEIKNYN